MHDPFPASADTIVVGAGPAGCALVGRLAAGSDESILLLEAGPDYGPFGSGRWPADLLEACDLAETHPWGFDSGNRYPDRLIPFGRARVIGGCSAHNGCAAIWGHRADYDAWAALGNDGWSTDEILPFLRSVSAAMRVRIPTDPEVTPYQRAMLDAAPAAGIPRVTDLNDLDEPIGIAPSPANIVNGVRWNSAFAFLDPVRSRPNLEIRGDTLVDRLLIERGRAIGVRAIGADGPYDIRAGRVVLAAGAYGSPAILLRSGIGNPDHLQAIDIPVQLPLNGVGCNLHDHPAIYLEFEGTSNLRAQMETFQSTSWLPEEQTIAKARSSHCTQAFDLHIYPEGGPYAEGRLRWTFILPIACMTPRSRGRLELTSVDPHAPLDIDHGYISDSDGADRAVLVDGVEIGRTIASQPSVVPLVGRETGEGRGARSAAEVAAWIDRSVTHYYHPVGTCAMGPATEPFAVVDARGKLHGLEGAHVADCSIIPIIPRANTNIPACVIGGRIASWLLTPRESTT